MIRIPLLKKRQMRYYRERDFVVNGWFIIYYNKLIHLCLHRFPIILVIIHLYYYSIIYIYDK